MFLYVEGTETDKNNWTCFIFVRANWRFAQSLTQLQKVFVQFFLPHDFPPLNFPLLYLDAASCFINDLLLLLVTDYFLWLLLYFD